MDALRNSVPNMNAYANNPGTMAGVGLGTEMARRAVQPLTSGWSNGDAIRNATIPPGSAPLAGALPHMSNRNIGVSNFWSRLGGGDTPIPLPAGAASQAARLAQTEAAAIAAGAVPGASRAAVDAARAASAAAAARNIAGPPTRRMLSTLSNNTPRPVARSSFGAMLPHIITQYMTHQHLDAQRLQGSGGMTPQIARTIALLTEAHRDPTAVIPPAPLGDTVVENNLRDLINQLTAHRANVADSGLPARAIIPR